MYDFFCLFLEIFQSELGILSLFGWKNKTQEFQINVYMYLQGSSYKRNRNAIIDVTRYFQGEAMSR